MNDQIEDIDKQAEELQQKFQAITDKVTGGGDATNAEALELLKLIAGLNANLTITNELLHSIQELIPQMTSSLGERILLRTGRTDKKIKRAVVKIIDEHIERMWDMVRMQAVAVADAIRQQNTDKNAETAAES